VLTRDAILKDLQGMFGGGKTAAERREDRRVAEEAAERMLDALAAGDVDRARAELNAAPRKTDFADIGWKLHLAAALIDLAARKRRAGNAKLLEFVRRLGETGLSRDDRGYLSLFALYRSIEASKNGRAPAALREQVEDFRFDHMLVSRALRERFPLKSPKLDEGVEAPPFSAPRSSTGRKPF